jgi:small-conductance mechanosensitive channel
MVATIVKFLNKMFLQNTIQQWLIAVAVVCGVFILMKFLEWFTAKKVAAWAKTTTTEVDDLFVQVLGASKLFFDFSVAIYVGSGLVKLPADVREIIGIVFIVAVLLQVGFWGNSLIVFWLNRTLKKRIAEDAASATTLTALGYLGRLVLWSVVVLVALDNVGVNITGLAAGLGIGGIAVALAIQNILGDLFASLSIVLDKPFVIGDFIVVDTFMGTVEHIGLKTTRLRSLSGEQVIFSNTDLLGSRIRNYKRMYERRVVFTIGLVHQTPLEKVESAGKILKEIIELETLARFDRAHFKEFGDSALVYEIVYFIKTSDFNVYMDTQQRINLAIMRRFEEQGIAFAYPTRTVYMYNNPGTEKNP